MRRGEGVVEEVGVVKGGMVMMVELKGSAGCAVSAVMGCSHKVIRCSGTEAPL